MKMDNFVLLIDSERTMRIKKRIIRCAYCRHEVHGTGMPHNGILYCSRSCRELGIDRLMRNLAGVYSPWLVVLAILAMLLSMAITDKAEAHDPYTGWTIPGQSKSCCNMKDCKATPAKYDRGNWWAFFASRKIWVQVPDDRIVRYKTDDTDAHLCISEHDGEIFCFRPPVQGM